MQKLEDEARELASTISEQSLDLKEQRRELEELRCRTPRPSWPHLYGDMHAAGALSPAEPAETLQQQTSSQLAEQLSRRVIAHAKDLQVCPVTISSSSHSRVAWHPTCNGVCVHYALRCLSYGSTSAGVHGNHVLHEMPAFVRTCSYGSCHSWMS